MALEEILAQVEARMKKAIDALKHDLAKQLHKKVEEGRVEIRTLRRHAHDDLKSKEKSSGVTTDEVKRVEAQLQKLTDRYILTADEIGQAKEKEILSV